MKLDTQDENKKSKHIEIELKMEDDDLELQNECDIINSIKNNENDENEICHLIPCCTPDEILLLKQKYSPINNLDHFVFFYEENKIISSFIINDNIENLYQKLIYQKSHISKYLEEYLIATNYYIYNADNDDITDNLYAKYIECFNRLSQIIKLYLETLETLFTTIIINNSQNTNILNQILFEKLNGICDELKNFNHDILIIQVPELLKFSYKNTKHRFDK